MRFPVSWAGYIPPLQPGGSPAGQGSGSPVSWGATDQGGAGGRHEDSTTTYGLGPGAEHPAVQRRQAGRSPAGQGSGSVYDPIAELYDDWSRRVTEDIGFYVEEAVAAGGPIVELGVGTGRLAVPTAAADIPVIGIDSSTAMLDVCRQSAARAGVTDLLDLRLGDYRRPPVGERVRLVTAPFRAYLHLHTDSERFEAFRAAFELLQPGGRFVFDVFAPSREDIRETHGRWLEREPGIWERANWNPHAQRFDLSVRGEGGETTMPLAWLGVEEWRALLESAGFERVDCFGWFDHRPYRGGEDMVFVAHRPR